jgi:glutamate racemase
VPLIEAGKANSAKTLELLAKYLEPIQDAGSDTLVLGCTHYPFLRKAIRKLLGDSMHLIDTSEAVVRQLKRQLEPLEISSQNNSQSSVIFISSKDQNLLLDMAQDLLSSDLSGHIIKSKQLGDMQ